MPATSHILVIEDNDLVREVLTLELTEAAYQVHAVPDGPAGIAASQANPPDAVVLDLKLPGMNGRTVLRTLKELYPDVPVYLFTVYGDMPQSAELREADGCFVKSSDLTPLLAALGRATGRGTADVAASATDD